MISLEPIGIVHTPYADVAPFRPDHLDKGEFYLEIFEDYLRGLKELEKFSHLILIFYFDRTETTILTAHPPMKDGKEVGVFASRSPKRPSKLGMNTAKIIKISGNRIYTSPLDALDGTPLIDIKPYIPDLDCLPDANSGWIDE